LVLTEFLLGLCITHLLVRCRLFFTGKIHFVFDKGSI
jgi:hypothetical protein